jgi:nucleoid-associated protein YejK
MSEESKKSDVTVNQMIVHKIIKAQKGDVTVKLRESVLPINNNSVQFVESFSESYRLRRAKKIYGEFNPDMDNYPVAGHLRTYLHKRNLLDFSEKVTRRLEALISRIPMATGGYMFFMDYSYKEEPHFAILILTNKGGTSIDDETLDITSSLALDIDEINMAADIKVGQWQEDQYCHTYLSFTRGKKDVARYFLDCLGCENPPNGAKATSDFISAFESFTGKEGDGYIENQDELIERKHMIHALMKNTPHELSMDTLLGVAFPDEETRSKFKAHIERNGIQLPDLFDPDGRSYKRLVEFKYKGNGIELHVDNSRISELIGFTDDGFCTIKDPDIQQSLKEYTGNI